MMQRPSIVREGVSIVFAGAFNPAIFHPTWYSHHELIPEEAAESADPIVATPQFAMFSTDQFDIQVTDDRFIAHTAHPHLYEPLRDLVVGTFRLLKHTPLMQMGINREVHFSTPSADIWNRVGHELAPKNVWDAILDKPGMKTLVIEGERTDDYKGAINVKVEPSVNVRFGVYVHINDHFDVADKMSQQLSAQLIETLENEWSNSFQRGEQIVDRIGQFIGEIMESAR